MEALHDVGGQERKLKENRIFFCRRYCKAPWIFLLQDHGFGGNYAGFGHGTLMEKVMEANDCWPKNVICSEDTRIWNHYEKVDADPVIGGLHRNLRFLYKRCAF